MKQIKISKLNTLKNLGLLTAVFGGLSFYSFNCAPPSFQMADGTATLASNGEAITGDPSGGAALDPKIVAPQALLTAEQIYESMMNLTEQKSTVTNNQLAEFDRRSGAFSVAPELDKVNAPMMIALSSFSGEVCNGLLVRELCENGTINGGQCTNVMRANPASQKKYFSALNLTVNIAQNSAASYDNFVAQLSNRFYGRAPAAEEVTLYQAFKTNFLSGAADSTQQARNLALATCAAMLSSFDTFTY